MKICIIPAKENSKRITNKNTKLFNGKPLVSWAIENAIKVNIFDEIYVSSDSTKILKIAQKYNINFIFRPKYLTKSKIPILKVISHAIKKIKVNKSLVCCMLPTSPIIKPKYLKEAFRKFKITNPDYVISVSKFSHPIERSLIKNDSNFFRIKNKKNSKTRTQDFIENYFDAGQFYIANDLTWKKNKDIFSNNTYGIIIPNYLVNDIDDINDWNYAKKLQKIISK